MNYLTALFRVSIAKATIAAVTTKNITRFYLDTLQHGKSVAHFWLYVLLELQTQFLSKTKLHQLNGKSEKQSRHFGLPQILTSEEALAIIGLQSMENITKEDLSKRYRDLMIANQPSPPKYDGSPYIQTKIHYAWRVLKRKIGNSKNDAHACAAE
ncbi:hypothetical protein GNI_100800 [Gregarina niphandrodes]|uniref:DnaJ domain protein n=1 Tax=Gregarina niphandrodes TaxID=110365 RepID=A0A023B4J0_GRENI|nr:hypothetical protein GNI_100800 [Gregarina niphandrodes]EZG56821.1 hypothetical protein GNI_100800 [Gregarina niphandrodes]|eukprot:XP_011131143.1 hypothetical protein GNI_100800 [Gregarina niphandrodes]